MKSKVNKRSRWSRKGKKKEERVPKHQRPNILFTCTKVFSLVFSLFWRDCNLVDLKRKQLVPTSFFFPSAFQPNTFLNYFLSQFPLIFFHLSQNHPNQTYHQLIITRKLEKIFECGTFDKRCLTQGISAISIILNEKS